MYNCSEMLFKFRKSTNTFSKNISKLKDISEKFQKNFYFKTRKTFKLS